MNGYNTGKHAIIGHVNHGQTTLIEHVTENQLSNNQTNQNMEEKSFIIDAGPRMEMPADIIAMPKVSSIWTPLRSQKIKAKRRKARR